MHAKSLDTFKLSFHNQIDEVFKMFETVPFGNSEYQFENHTPWLSEPARRYRQCLLELDRLFKVLHENKCHRGRCILDLEDVEDKISDLESRWFRNAVQERALKRLYISREEAEYGLKECVNKFHDAIAKAESYYKELMSLPRFTREQFEQEERDAWTRKLKADFDVEVLTLAGPTKGTILALRQQGILTQKNRLTNEFRLLDFGNYKKLAQQEIDPGVSILPVNSITLKLESKQ